MENETQKWIGKNVNVTIDRPLGSSHPDFPECIYKVNYGYIAGTLAADGEPIDAYVLGVDKPVIKYDGVVIAIIEREDDIEFKLVVAQSNKYSISEIKQLVDFQEKYFKSKVIN